MRIRVPTLTADDAAALKRKAEFQQRVIAGHAVRRRVRRRRLAGQEGPVRQAVGLYERIDREMRPEVGIRAGFVRLDRPRPPKVDAQGGQGPYGLREDWAGRPPATRLVARRSNAMAVFLTAIYVAHIHHGPKEQVTNRYPNATTAARNHLHWAALAGLGGGPTPRARRTRVTRALTDLAAAGLVDLRRGGSAGRFEDFQLLRDDGSETPYLVPGAGRPNVLSLPAAFFVRGWHLVLEPDETAMFLAICDMTARAGRRRDGEDPGVALPESERWARYGISGEVYEAVHDLREFGLLELYDPMPNRRLGKWRPLEARSADDDADFRPVPYRFIVNESALNEDAWTAVNRAFTGDLPARFTR